MTLRTFSHRLGAGLLLLASSHEAAQAQVENLRWVKSPPPELSAEYMPLFAEFIGVSGSVRMSCEALIEGPPQNCAAVAVAPEGLGFEQAGLELAATGIVRPRHEDGRPVPSRFNFTANFVAEPIPSTTKEAIYLGPAPGEHALQLARRVVEDYHDQFLARTWEDAFDDLDHDRKAIVRAWLEELLPIDIERAFADATLAVARSVPLAELERYSKDGTPPTNPTPEMWEKANTGLHGNDLNPKIRELRRRFCERWSCSADFE